MRRAYQNLEPATVFVTNKLETMHTPKLLSFGHFPILQSLKTKLGVLKPLKKPLLKLNHTEIYPVVHQKSDQKSGPSGLKESAGTADGRDLSSTICMATWGKNGHFGGTAAFTIQLCMYIYIYIYMCVGVCLSISISMSISMSISISFYIYIHIYVYIYMYIYIYTYVYIYIYIYVCIHIYIYIYTYMSIYMYIYIYTYVYIYIYVCIHIYICGCGSELNAPKIG